MSGTIPAVKERPKVAKRPTIPAVPAVKERAKIVRRSASSIPAVPSVQARAETTGQLTATGDTIPPVKQRPKVAKHSTITADTIPAKKPLVKKKAEPKEAEQARPSGWINWMPVAAGIALGCMAPQIHALAALWDPWGLRIVFPWVQLAGLHEIGMSDELTRTLPQLMLYLQFPLEGLLVASSLRRGMRFSAAFGAIPSLHFVAGLVLWIVALGSSRPI